MNDQKLRVKWSKRENDFMIYYPCGPDGHLAHNFFNSKQHHPFDDSWSDSFFDELKARGYDLTTLKFEVTRFPKEIREAVEHPATKQGVSTVE